MAVSMSRVAPGHGLARAFGRIFGSQEMVLFLAILTLFVVVGTINPRYVAERNLQSIFLGNAYIAVAAIGMSMVIITGNIDVSVGALIGVLATISGQVIRTGIFQEKAFTEAFNFKLSIRLLRNPNMAANGRFPTAVGDFKYEISN